MSFILDALRKSERERQRGEVPPISSVPIAVARHSAPVWAIAAITLLGAALLVVGWGWWQTLASSGTGETGAAAAARSKATAPSSNEAAATALPTAAAPAPRPLTQPQAPAARITLRELAAASEPAAPPRAPEASAAPAPVFRPSLGELRAEGIAVPDLTLELHVYSDDAAERFVFINGSRYQEGDTLKEGPTVRAILPEGVALVAEGREFLLPRN